MNYGILIYDGVEPIDIGATFGVLSMAKRIAPEINAIGIAKNAGEVICSNGLKCIADMSFETAANADIDELIVTGGPGWVEASKDLETQDYIRGFHSKPNGQLSAICTGAMILETSGVLGGHTTTKTRVYEGEKPPSEMLEEKGFSIKEAALVKSEGILTSGGVTLGIDALFHLLERNHGEKVAQEVAYVMEYDRALSANREHRGYAFS